MSSEPLPFFTGRIDLSKASINPKNRGLPLGFIMEHVESILGSFRVEKVKDLANPLEVCVSAGTKKEALKAFKNDIPFHVTVLVGALIFYLELFTKSRGTGWEPSILGPQTSKRREL